MEKLKRCSKCEREYPATTEFFYKRTNSPDGLRFWCKKCDLKANKNWSDDNRQKKREGNRLYYRRNKEKCAANHRRWASKNKERLKSYFLNWISAHEEHVKTAAARRGKAWTKANPERAKARTRNYRARKRNAIGSFTGEDIKELYHSQNGKCWWCGKAVGDNYHIDHRIPLSRGGTNAPNNLCISCANCNLRKWNKMSWEWNGRLL